MTHPKPLKGESLLPCPFCGCAVDMERTTDSYDELHGRRKWWGIRCRSTKNRGGTCAMQITPQASPEAAAERWNRRTPAQPEPATPAASVERALAELIACEDLLLARGSEKSAEKRRAMTSEHATRFQAALAAGRNALRAHLEKQHG